MHTTLSLESEAVNSTVGIIKHEYITFVYNYLEIINNYVEIWLYFNDNNPPPPKKKKKKKKKKFANENFKIIKDSNTFKYVFFFLRLPTQSIILLIHKGSCHQYATLLSFLKSKCDSCALQL